MRVGGNYTKRDHGNFYHEKKHSHDFQRFHKIFGPRNFEDIRYFAPLSILVPRLLKFVPNIQIEAVRLMQWNKDLTELYLIKIMQVLYGLQVILCSYIVLCMHIRLGTCVYLFVSFCNGVHVCEQIYVHVCSSN